MKTVVTLLYALALLLQGCGQPPAFVERDPGSNALPKPVLPDGPGGRIDDHGNPVDDDDNDPFDPNKELYQLGQSFVAGSAVSDGLSVDLNDPFIEKDLTMSRAYFNRSLSYTQVNRPTITDNHNQGHPASPVTDTITQNESDHLLDILVVVDNSGSMAQEQANLATKLAPLLQEVADTNWRIAVNTTDPAKGCVNHIINKGDANIAAKFQTAVNAGINGSGNEVGVLQAVNGLKGECLSSPWVRNDSNVAVLIVSDEDNCSNGNGCGTQPHKSASFLSDYLSSIRVLGTNARVYGIVWHPSQTQAQCSTGAFKANQYASLIAGTNGTWGSICDADYTNTLAAISTDISISLNTQFTLSHNPVPGSLVVRVNGALQSGNYNVTQNIVTFTSNPPPEGATVTFDYNHDSAPIVASFDLSKNPAAGTLKVFVNGSLVGPAAYNYDAANNEVDFVSPPAHNALVSLQYRENSPALISSFALSGSVNVSSIGVKVNGSSVSSGVSFHTPSNSVVFATAPADNASIVVTYQEIGSAILSYAFAVDANLVDDMEIEDAISGSPIPFAYMGGNIIFGAGVWVEGRQVVIRYPNAGFGQMSVSLPHTPISASVSAEAGGMLCANLTVTGNVVNLSGCNFPVNAGQVDIEYLYLPAGSSTFTFTPAIPVSLDDVLWDVTVNGSAFYNYTRTGRVFTFNSAVPSGTVVKVNASYYN